MNTIKINGDLYKTIVINGDVDGDGKILATDYVAIKNHIMGAVMRPMQCRTTMQISLG